MPTMTSIPSNLVKITKPFYLGATEVTQEQYQQVMVENPSHFKVDPQRPVEWVSWEDAVEFCRRLSKKSPLVSIGDGRGRLNAQRRPPTMGLGARKAASYLTPRSSLQSE
jgi:formylglycine-generating enzyme required for sulfatase activity